MRELGSNAKGAIAESAIRLAAIRSGVGVYQPTTGHSRADLLFEIADDLYRVQVKWGRLSTDGGAVIVQVGGSSLSPRGYVRSTYSAAEVDLLAIHCGELDRSFLVPISMFEGLQSLCLRLTPPRNNQRACINLAEEYEFAGAVAQLGERRHGMAEARGSSPLSSTSSPSLEPTVITVGSNPFRDRLGYWMDVVAAGQEVIVTRRGRRRLRLTPAA